MHLPPRVLVMISLAIAASLLGDSLLYAVLPTIWMQLNLELWMVGVLLSANRFIRFITNPLAGRVIERYGIRGPFIAAMFLAAITTGIYGFNFGFYLFLLARILWGLCWSFLRLGGFLTALEFANDGNRGYYLGFYSGVGRLGTLVSVLLGGFLTDMVGFQETIWAFAILTFFIGISILGVQIDQKVDGKFRHHHVPTPEKKDALLLKPDRRRWAIYAATFINGMAGSQLIVATIGLWLLETYGETIQITTFAVGVASLTGILLAGRYLIESVWSPSAGHLSDRLHRLKFLVIVGTLTVVTMIGFSIDMPFFWAVLLAFGIFIGGTAIRVTLDALASEASPPAARARVLSWYSNWADLGNAVGPFLAYQLVGVMGLSGLYRSGAVFLAVGGFITLVLMREKSQV